MIGKSLTNAATNGIIISIARMIAPIIIMVLLSIPATHCPSEDFVYTLNFFLAITTSHSLHISQSSHYHVNP